MKNALILLSGGIDSLCCAHFMQNQGFRTEAVFIDYGQAAVVNEQTAVEKIAKYLKIPITILKFECPKNFAVGELKGRNLFLYSSGYFGCSFNTGVISSGIHSGTKYYDCSAKFQRSFSNLLSEMTDGKVEAFAPFLNWSKVEVYKYALDNDLPLGLTHSCESDLMTPCGECLSCLDLQLLQSLQNDVS